MLSASVFILQNFLEGKSIANKNVQALAEAVRARPLIPGAYIQNC